VRGNRPALLAWSLCAISVGLVVVSIVFSVLVRDVPNQGEAGTLFDILLGLGILVFPVVGALIASRRPENSIGWLFCAVGVPLGLSGVANGWATYALFEDPGGLPGGQYAAWLGEWLFLPALFAVPPLLFLLFPDGRPPTRRWRPVVHLVAVAIVVATVAGALSPGRLEEQPFRGVENPVGIEAAGGVLDVVSGVGFAALFVSILLAVVALVLRFRRARGEERQQLKWFASAGALFALACIAALSPWMPSSDTAGQLAILLTFACIPVAAGVAILRYRLYDIDLVINRALVYGALTATLAGGYLGLVLLLQLVLSPGSDLAIAGSTLAVAALFRPLRGRIQGLVDRRFYRSRYDAARTLEGFGVRLRNEIDLGTLDAELSAVVRETLQPAHVSLWLRSP
jgi:MFS family permease